jgi:hypothetical protein
VTHEVLACVTEQVVALGAVAAEVERGRMARRLERRSTISYCEAFMPPLSSSQLVQREE